jgi:hypothetical protein
MPRCLRSVIVVRRCGSERPNRSSFQTTRQSPCLDEGERLYQTCSISTAAADPILEQMTFIDTGSDQSITLQVQHLAVAVRRDAHVADQHVRKPLLSRFPHSVSFRQGLSHTF